MNRIVLWFFRSAIGKRIELQVLTNLVTSSLSLPARNVITMSTEEALSAFASLTAEHLPTSLPKQQERLHRRSLRLGTMLRRMLSDRSDRAVTQLVILLYRNINIEMEGLLPEQINVRRCFFSNYYAATTCTIASLMDSGIIEGLYGRGRLCFTERITEGNSHCSCCIKE